MIFAPMGALTIVLLVYVLMLVVPPLSVLMVLAFRRKWRLAGWLRRHPVMLGGLVLLQVLVYGFCLFVYFSFQQISREAAAERAQEEIRRYPVLTEARMVREILAPAGSRIDLGYGDDWNEAVSADFATPVSWNGLPLRRIDWIYSKIVLAEPARIEGWLCAAGETLRLQQSEAPIEVLGCTLAEEALQDGVRLPAGTVVGKVGLHSDACMAQMREGLIRGPDAPHTASEPDACRNDPAVDVWWAEYLGGATPYHWQGRRWHKIYWTFTRSDGRLYSWGGEPDEYPSVPTGVVVQRPE
ncbi:hypothetical protein ACTSKR_11720 [Chitinibacteraceae bacterium HSL-7]